MQKPKQHKLIVSKIQGAIIGIEKMMEGERTKTYRNAKHVENYNGLRDLVIAEYPEIKHLMPPAASTMSSNRDHMTETFADLLIWYSEIFEMINTDDAE